MGIFKIFNVTTTMVRRDIEDTAVVAQRTPDALTHCLHQLFSVKSTNRLQSRAAAIFSRRANLLIGVDRPLSVAVVITRNQDGPSRHQDSHYRTCHIEPLCKSGQMRYSQRLPKNAIGKRHNLLT